MQRLVPMMTHSISGNVKEQVTELARQLLQFEDLLDWEFVDAESFRRIRGTWRAQLSKASSLRHLETCFRDFIKDCSRCHSYDPAALCRRTQPSC